MFSPRPTFPIQSGSLRGLPGIPSPICLFHITCYFEGPDSKQRYEQISQQERTIRRRIQKIIRRLLLKAGVPLLGKEDRSKSYEGMMFQVDISISLLQEDLLSYSVRMQIIQEVLLARDPNIKIEAVTWDGGSITGYSRRQEVKDFYAVEDIVENSIKEHIVEKVRSLASSYWNDNEPDDMKQMESDGRYDTGPLDES